jgi:hypothetical protein
MKNPRTSPAPADASRIAPGPMIKRSLARMGSDPSNASSRNPPIQLCSFKQNLEREPIVTPKTSKDQPQPATALAADSETKICVSLHGWSRRERWLFK